MNKTPPSKLEALLATYPRSRTELPATYQRIYTEQYLSNRSGTTAAASAAQRLERWLHRQVASDLGGAPGPATLELGAGTLNQLPFEPGTAPYDVVEPFEALFEQSPLRSRVRDIFPDIADVPQDRRYARITSVAALEHVCDLPALLARAALLLADGGMLRSAIPSEGGLLWRIGWTCTTGLEFRLRHGLDYGVLMRHEHVNTAREIETLVSALFEQVEIRSLGVGRNLSLYRFSAASRPRVETAREWMSRFPPASGPADRV